MRAFSSPFNSCAVGGLHSKFSTAQSVRYRSLNPAKDYLQQEPVRFLNRPFTAMDRSATLKRSIECRSQIKVENYELVIGDSVLLTTFCMYKQIISIVLSPSFPGWLAPLKFNYERILELISFIITLNGTWLSVAALVGAYKLDATADLRTALVRISQTWLASMPVVAAQLVLLVAAEDEALVGSEGFAQVLPLAASGPGEPFVTAAGVLGLMACWRAWYAINLDIYNFRTSNFDRIDRETEEQHFKSSLQSAALLAVGGCVLIEILSNVVGEERLETFFASLHLI